MWAFAERNLKSAIFFSFVSFMRSKTVGGFVYIGTCWLQTLHFTIMHAHDCNQDLVSHAGLYLPFRLLRTTLQRPVVNEDFCHTGDATYVLWTQVLSMLFCQGAARTSRMFWWGMQHVICPVVFSLLDNARPANGKNHKMGVVSSVNARWGSSLSSCGLWQESWLTRMAWGQGSSPVTGCIESRQTRNLSGHCR